MPAADVDLHIVRGDRFEQVIERYAAGPIDLTGRVHTAQIRETPDSATAISFGIVTSSHAQGKVILTLTGAQTASIVDGSWWDLEERLGAGQDPRTIVGGRVRVRKDVTR